ncbi:MAG: M3 family metallopeptidase [Pseudomonadota bacterium]
MRNLLLPGSRARALRHALAVTAYLAYSSAIQAEPLVDISTVRDGWNFNLPAAEVSELCERTLERAAIAFTAIESDNEPPTLERVMGAYQDMRLGLQNVQYLWYLKAVHPDTAVQEAAQSCIGHYTDFMVSTRLSNAFYARVSAIDLTEADAAARTMVEDKLRGFRRAGVDRDEETRTRVRNLNREISELSNRFDQNIRLDRREVLASEDELAGLPDDFIASHRPNEEGIVTLTTDYPVVLPVMKYAHSDALRQRLYTARKRIGTPTNDETLASLIARRHELATLLGFPSYAALSMDGLMIGSPEKAREFLDELDEAVRPGAQSDIVTLLDRLRQIDPEAERVEAWQAAYLSNLVRQEHYAIDTREIRTYLSFARVQEGIFKLTEDLFDVQIVPWHTDTWHEDVTAWEIRENGEPLGRFYLDMHPRENKYTHAAHWTLRRGLLGGQLPLSGMATNFPRGLMEHQQVSTFLHEFGHLLHNMFSGTQHWLPVAGMTMERDFVEAPSQMLEEWVWDYDTLNRFAVNADGQTIPPSLVDKMQRARHFGEAAATAGQIFYANLALEYFSRDPDSFELLPLMQELQERYSPYPYVPGTHFYNNFGHLNGYGSNYYMYQWSRAISNDLFSRFQQGGLRNTEVAQAYRNEILAPGGSRPAADSIAAFLGRPFSARAYATYLRQLNMRVEEYASTAEPSSDDGVQVDASAETGG